MSKARSGELASLETAIDRVIAIDTNLENEDRKRRAAGDWEASKKIGDARADLALALDDMLAHINQLRLDPQRVMSTIASLSQAATSADKATSKMNNLATTLKSVADLIDILTTLAGLLTLA